MNIFTRTSINRPADFFALFISWLLVAVFTFPALPLHIANSVFIIFAVFVFIYWLYKGLPNIGQLLKQNLLIALPFIPYLVEFLLYHNNKIADFQLEKKLFFFIAPVIISFYLVTIKLKPLRTYMYAFTISILAVTLYSYCLLIQRNIFLSADSFKNGAYLLRFNFEDISELHPTYYDFFAVIAIFWIIYDYKNHRSKLIRILLVTSGIILLSLSLLLAAKMSLIILVGGTVFLLYKQAHNKKSLLAIYGIMSVCIVLSIFIIPSLKSRVSEVKNYFKGEKINNTINERQNIFECSRTVFINNFWFGIGSRNMQNELNACYMSKNLPSGAVEGYNSHNQFLTIGINYGIFILLLFIATIVLFIKRVYTDYFAVLLIVSTVLIMLTESILERQWGVYFYVLFFLLLYREQVEDDTIKQIPVNN